VSPIPPSELRAITAAPEEELFLWTGLADLANLLQNYDRTTPGPLAEKLRILDFGCGCGRMTRYLNSIDSVEAHGTDANPDLAAWCQEHLDRVHTALNAAQPPMPFPDASFDLVYALSVFTHLSEERSHEWLADVARVLVPGGSFIATTHGVTALNVIRNSTVHQTMMNLDESATDALIRRLPDEGYIFAQYPPASIPVAKVGSEYGLSFIDGDYVRSNWASTNFELLDHLPGGLRGWHDIAVLRRT
jgi:cyclopropane fatty-acyl-phospholipid synthase-like methyltransferase